MTMNAKIHAYLNSLNEARLGASAMTIPHTDLGVKAKVCVGVICFNQRHMLVNC